MRPEGAATCAALLPTASCQFHPILSHVLVFRSRHLHALFTERVDMISNSLFMTVTVTDSKGIDVRYLHIKRQRKMNQMKNDARMEKSTTIPYLHTVIFLIPFFTSSSLPSFTLFTNALQSTSYFIHTFTILGTFQAPCLHID